MPAVGGNSEMPFPDPRPEHVGGPKRCISVRELIEDRWVTFEVPEPDLKLPLDEFCVRYMYPALAAMFGMTMRRG